MQISNFKNVLGAFLGFVMCMLICFSQLFITQSVLAETSLAPDAFVSEFYGWYLHSLAADHDPFRDDRTKLSKYVSKALIKEIERRMNSANGLDADYFIQAQDYLDDWENNISVAMPKINGNTASVVVTLGATKDSRHRLALILMKEDRVWKIRKIRAINGSIH